MNCFYILDQRDYNYSEAFRVSLANEQVQLMTHVLAVKLVFLFFAKVSVGPITDEIVEFLVWSRVGAPVKFTDLF